MADHPLRPARDRRLGEPLPHLLANPIWVHPIAQGRSSPALLGDYAVLATVSSSYPRADPIHYSAVRSSKQLLLPLDLHVLGLPPAFNLSHDQTLQLKSLMLKECLLSYVFLRKHITY